MRAFCAVFVIGIFATAIGSTGLGQSVESSSMPSTTAPLHNDDVSARLHASLESGVVRLPMSTHRDGLKLAGRCGATEYSCKDPTPYCCWTQAKGYYCAKNVNGC